MQNKSSQRTTHSATEHTFQILLNRIQREDISVGDKLPSEPTLCKELMVGRGTLREASKILQARGFLEIQPGKGTYIRSKTGFNNQELARWFSENELRINDVLQVRMALEPMAVRLAITRSSKKDLVDLQAIHACAVEAAAEKNSVQLALCDENFHAFISRCSRNRLLTEIVKNVNDLLKEFRGKTFLVDENIKNFLPAHEKILDAFKKKDPHAGAEYMVQHLSMVVKDLASSKEVP